MKKKNLKKTISLSIEKTLSAHVKAVVKLEKILYRDQGNLKCQEELGKIEDKISISFNDLRDHGYSLGEIYSIIDKAKSLNS